MNRQFTEKDYREYLIELIPSIFKILGLYEEENEFLLDYIDSLLRFELYGASESIGELPKSKWYGKTTNKLEGIELHLRNGSNPDDTEDHRKIKREVLGITNLIDRQIDHLKGEI